MSLLIIVTYIVASSECYQIKQNQMMTDEGVKAMAHMMTKRRFLVSEQHGDDGIVYKLMQFEYFMISISGLC